MTPDQIKHRLLLANVSCSALARKIGVSRQTVSTTVNGTSKVPWVRRHVAAAIGLPYEKVWGEDDPKVDRWRVHPGLPAVSTLVNTEQAA